MTIGETGIRRSEYLKNGCRECKRRKIKCDEFINPPPDAYIKINHQGRELCWNCTRLRKTCEYPSKGEKVPRVSRKALKKSNDCLSLLAECKDNSTVSPEEQKTPIHNESPNSKIYLLHSQGPAIEKSISPKNIVPVSHQSSVSIYGTRQQHHASRFDRGMYPQFYPGSIPDFSLATDKKRIGSETNWRGFTPGSHIFAHSQEGIPRMLLPISDSVPGLEQSLSYDSTDLSLIATDLNNLVSDMIVEVNNDLKVSTVTELKAPVMQTRTTGLQSVPRLRAKSYSHIPRNVGIGMFNVSQKERAYLQEFYLGFASVILPFNAFDTVQQSYYNPMRDILFYCAFNESFMLSAILAQGARSVFLKSNSADDEFSYFVYLLQCLELLHPALGGHLPQTNFAQLLNIEAVLLTVLLLTSSNAANLKQNWRPHLRGAKDILLKHTTSRKNPSTSKLLLLCKYWFVSIELLAGLGLKFGGTIESEDELDLLLGCLDQNDFQILSSLGLLSPKGFFLIGGYHVDLIPAWKDLIKLLNRRRKDSDYKLNDTLEYIRLLSIFEALKDIEFVNKKALLKNSDFQGGFLPAGQLLDLIPIGQDHIIISWMDLSQQLYCLAAIITILTNFFELNHDSQQIQHLVERMMSLLGFLSDSLEPPPVIKCAVMMVQWPLIVAGINLVQKKDQMLVLKFFDLAMNAGAGSAGHSISKIRSIWKSREVGTAGLIDDNADIVPY